MCNMLLFHSAVCLCRLCKSTWGHCSIYNRRLPAGFSYRRLYLQLDEGSLTFNGNAHEVCIHHTYICTQCKEAETPNQQCPLRPYFIYFVMVYC